MNISCAIITDLLPLYHDEVCNESSREFVKEHLEECSTCRAILEKLSDDTLDRHIKKERENVVGNHAQTVKEKSLVIGLTIAMVIPIVVTFIVNLATARTLSWFFIVLTAILVFGSITLVPLIVERNKGLWALGSFVCSLLLLLFTIDLLTSGRSWSLIPVTAILLGTSILFAPYILAKLPLTGFASRHKGLIAMVSNTLLLYMLLIIIGIRADNASYWRTAFLISFVCLLLPWLLFLTIRYLRVNAFVKAGLCFIYVGLFVAMINSVIEWILSGVWHSQLRYANLFQWRGYYMIDANITLLVLLIGCIVGGILVAIGLLRKSKR